MGYIDGALLGTSLSEGAEEVDGLLLSVGTRLGASLVDGALDDDG